MSATTPDVPLHPHTDRWVFRSGGESGRVSRAERRGVYGDDEARRACADAGEKPDRPWHRTTSSSRILTLRSRRVKAFLSLGEFAHDATAGIFNDYVALQVWAGTPVRSGRSGESQLRLLPVNPGIIVPECCRSKSTLCMAVMPFSLVGWAVSRPPFAAVQGAFEETFERGMYEP